MTIESPQSVQGFRLASIGDKRTFTGCPVPLKNEGLEELMWTCYGIKNILYHFLTNLIIKKSKKDNKC